MTGAEQIAAERQRQIEVEGWTPEHDASHPAGELTRAAACYASAASRVAYARSFYAQDRRGFDVWLAEQRREPPAGWPWEPEAWKPSEDPVRNLVKAGALIAADIDRIERTRRG